MSEQDYAVEQRKRGAAEEMFDLLCRLSDAAEMDRDQLYWLVKDQVDPLIRRIGGCE